MAEVLAAPRTPSLVECVLDRALLSPVSPPQTGALSLALSTAACAQYAGPVTTFKSFRGRPAITRPRFKQPPRGARGGLARLRTEASARAERDYEAGPATRRPQGWEQLGEDDPTFLREKKTRSAYVSRFRAQHYAQLLEEGVEAGEASVAMQRIALAREADENARLRAEVSKLRVAASRAARCW